jgi:predicted chitinase/pimeloyl-ACP methyl ester carboxylesterase
MTTIDISQIHILAPKPCDQYEKAFSAPNVSAILDKYGISKSPLRVCHFLAQVFTETGQLQTLRESLDYSASRLMVVWPGRFPTLRLAKQYEHNQQKLGNFVYANRLGNGDTASGDGFNFRGRGLIQITGRYAYTRYGNQLGIPLADQPDLAFDPDHCLEIAAAEWAVSGYQGKFCNELADEDDIDGVTRAINGGLTGIDDRIAWLKRCKAIWIPTPQPSSRAGSQDAAAGSATAAKAATASGRQASGQQADQAPVLICTPYFKRPRRTLASRIPSDARPWDLGDLCKSYSWPQNHNGGGVIAIVELDGGFTADDMAGFFQRTGLPAASITQVSIDGANNSPNQHIGQESDPDIEVTMDIQVAAAAYSIATGKAANICVYWAPNQPGAIAKAVRQATSDGCDTCSISWGADEGIWKSWTTSDIDYVEDMEGAASEAIEAGMIVFAATGDNDSSDGGSSPANVDVPSSCPSVIGCGGTTKTRSSEIVWNNDPGKSDGEGTGGGYSDYFPPPDWQAKAPQINQNPPRRMVPDVAANADPNTGYNLFVHGQYTNYGGTSAVAPLYAGLFAAFGRKLAPAAAKLWTNAGCFVDITQGENGKYNAMVGPDPCTGLGVPVASKLATLFSTFAPAAEQTLFAYAASVAAPFNPALATQYGLFVQAAYSMYGANPNNLMPEPTPDFPAAYELSAWIQMQDFILSSTGPTFYGFIAQSKTDPTKFVMAIRGTQTAEEWWDNLTSITKTPFGEPNSGSVAYGFNRIYQTMEIVERPSNAAGAALAARSLKPAGSFAQQANSLFARLSRAAVATARVPGASLPAGASVTVVGHSLGAALATMYTMENAGKVQNPLLCTFASPRVGDADFVKAFAALPLTSWRIVNDPDVVPKLPPEIAGFEHVNVEQLYNSSNTAKNTFGCWHAMSTYLSLIDPTRKPDPDCQIDTVAGAALAARSAISARDVLAAKDIGAPSDCAQIAKLIAISSNSSQLQEAQAEAARLLLAYDGEQYPSDGCAITLSVLLQQAGIDVADTYQAIVLGNVLKQRGWTQVPIGSQQAGDVGSTCGPTPHHGTDHIYLVLRAVNEDEMVIADNQATEPHFRYASGQGGKSPTKFFLRAP